MHCLTTVFSNRFFSYLASVTETVLLQERHFQSTAQQSKRGFQTQALSCNQTSTFLSTQPHLLQGWIATPKSCICSL